MSLPAEYLTQSVGWTLLHSIWQIACVWCVHTALQWTLRRSSAHARYLAACGSLIAAVLIVAGTGVALFSGQGLPNLPINAAQGLIELLHIPDQQTAWARLLRSFRHVAPVVAGVWVMWVVVRLAATAAAWRRDLSVVAGAKPLPAEAVPLSWSRLTAKIACGADVRLLGVEGTSSPVTLGWFRPIVLLPVGLLTDLSPFAIDALLAHELAHIRRRDYVVNIVQSFAETVLWFHPLVWAMSTQIRVLREECCDDLAIQAIGGEPTKYARVLMDLDFRRPPSLAMGATGSPLSQRITYLLSARGGRSARYVKHVAVMAVGLVVAVGMSSRTIASRVAFDADVAVSAQIDLYEEIYTLLGAEAPNSDFVPAVTLAVQRSGDKTFDRVAAMDLARVIAKGVPHDALFEASKTFYDAKYLRPLKRFGWKGGAAGNWDNLASAMVDFARSTTEASERRLLTRSALLLAAQIKFSSGGYLNRLGREPDLQFLSGFDNTTIRRLNIALSTFAVETGQSAIALLNWKKTEPSTVPESLRTRLRKRPDLQWMLANYIHVVSIKDPARADALLASARAGGLDVCVAVVRP